MTAVLRARERSETPWRNGGGTTATIAASPIGAGLDDFDWRISTATIARPGPFSIFPGVDRHRTVLDGALAVTMDAGSPITLAAGECIGFAADIPVVGMPVEGLVTDLNVMTRRGLFASDVRRIANEELDLRQGDWIIVATDGVTVAMAGLTLTLDTLDAIAFSGPAIVSIDGHCLLIGIRALVGLPASRLE